MAEARRGEEGEAVPRPAALAQWSLAFAFYLHDMWAHYNFNRLNLFAALQIKCWVLFYATPAAKFHVQLSFVRHRQGARAAWEGVVCSSPFVFAKRVSFSLNLCLNLWFGNVYVVSKGSYHVPRCGNIKWREGEGESEVKILQCLLRFPVHICRAALQKKARKEALQIAILTEGIGWMEMQKQPNYNTLKIC